MLVGGLACRKVEAEKNAPSSLSAGKPPAAVDLFVVKSAGMSDGIEVVGTLASKFQADVKSEFTGIAAEVYVREWVTVRKGQPLAKLDTRESEIMLSKAKAAVDLAKSGLMQAEVGLTRANREYERMQKLKEAGLVTRQNLDDAESMKDAAKAQVAAANSQIQAVEEEVRHAQTRLSKALITSPMDGVVAMCGVNVGDLVGEMGSPKLMFQIVDNRLLNLTMTVPSNELDRLKIGQPVTFTTDALNREFTGKVMFINPSLNATDRSVGVIAEVKNPRDELKGGLFVHGKIITGNRQNILQVPRQALLDWDVDKAEAKLFVTEGKSARLRAVATGQVVGDMVEVKNQLQAGEQVIVRGGFNLKDGDPVIIGSVVGE
jgi:RND family efflux transporter MFP subunit